jgi:hypothetical protein
LNRAGYDAARAILPRRSSIRMNVKALRESVIIVLHRADFAVIDLLIGRPALAEENAHDQ